MVRSRSPRTSRPRREPSGVCESHQELRDIAVETRNDVKHILESLGKGDTRMNLIEERVDSLESIEDTRKGFEASVKSIATTRATVVSLIISAVGVIVAIVAIVWPHKGP